MTSPGEFPAAESAERALSKICGGGGAELQWDPPRRFYGYAERLRLLLAQLLCSAPAADLAGVSVHTAFLGMAADLSAAAIAFSKYREKGEIFVLIHCKPLCSSLQECATSIGNWIALLLDSPLPFSNPDLRRKAADLALDLQQANLRVTENEERIFCTLQKEGEMRVSSRAVQSAIAMDLARALGVEATDHKRLADHLKLLKRDVSGPSTVTERRILVSLEKIFEKWSPECAAGDEEEDAAEIPPYRNFLCPLTKAVMKDPVVLESSQTYERSAIDHWFNRCLEDGRDPTCPVTGQVLESMEMKPNLGLRGAIEEWTSRTIESQVRSASQILSAEEDDDGACSTERLEKAMDSMYRISEDHPSSRYRVRNGGIVPLMVRALEQRRKATESQLRAIALMALHSISRDEESKMIMIGEGVTRLAIRSLTSSLEDEKEFALKLLLEFSHDEGYCVKLASEKGALLLLSTMAGDPELPVLSNIAEDLLKNMEKMKENIRPLAAAGRFQPLLARLSEGGEDLKIEMATVLGEMSLASSDKEQIARKCGRIMIAMISSARLEARSASLKVLNNLATLDDNAAILVEFGALPPLTSILFDSRQDDPMSLKLLAAATMANVVSQPGHWELASADRNGNRMQSEWIIHRLLQFLSSSSSSSDCQAAVLQILCGIASSPQASDSAASFVRSGNGVRIIVPFLEHADPDCRIYAYRLANLLSEKLRQAMANELISSGKLLLLKEKLLDARSSNEKTEVASILANLPIPGDLVKKILGLDLLKWTVSSLHEQRFPSMGSNSRRAAGMLEGLLGILVHFSRSADPEIRAAVCENQFMAIFRKYLSSRCHAREKQRAAVGLKLLSQSAASAAPQRRHRICTPALICGGTWTSGAACPIHGAGCGDENSGLCLLRGDSVKQLILVMENDEDSQVQIAAADALSTLVAEPAGIRSGAVAELEKLGLIAAVTEMVKRVRVGELQEKLIWMVEKLCNSEAVAQRYAMDQALVRSLMQALKHGNPNAKRAAQDALTSLQQLSAIATKIPTNSGVPRRINR